MKQLTAFCFIFTILVIGNSTMATVWSQEKAYHSRLPRALDMSPAFSARSKVHCSVLCQTHWACNSFFFNGVDGRCLLQRLVYVSPVDAVYAPGWRYFRLTAASCPRRSSVIHNDYVIDRVSESCYTVVTSKLMSWEDAREKCEEHGERLAVLEPAQKASFIHAFMNANKVYPTGEEVYYYIGGSRPEKLWNTEWPATGPDFTWMTGRPVNYTATAAFWRPDRPNNLFGVENVIALRSGESFLWEDLAGNHPKFSLCERPLLQ